MKIKCLLIFILFLYSGGNCICQENPGNLYLIDKLINESFLSLENKMTSLGNDKFFEIEINQDKPEEIYFLDKIKQRFNGYKLFLNEKFDTSDYRITFSNIIIKPIYSNLNATDFTGNKLTGREIRVSYDYVIVRKENNERLYSDRISKKTKDNFDSERINQVEDNRYIFTKAKLPDEEGLEKYLFPSLIVAVSAAAIIMFFSIRSN
ncbi:MAG: hypothetical protein IPM38_17780 [Ignavibacteria bacterium]|nr:hypothetical protein [Ignavibacteria bacterium]